MDSCRPFSSTFQLSWTADWPTYRQTELVS